jgi:hypothetical protein
MRQRFALVVGVAVLFSTTSSLAQETKAPPIKVETKSKVATKVAAQVVAPAPKTAARAAPASAPAVAAKAIVAPPPAAPTVVATTTTTATTATPLAPPLPGVNPDDLTSIIRGLFDSAKAGKWALLVGFIVMLLTWIVNALLRKRIPSNIMPWIAVALSTAIAIATAFSTGAKGLNAVIVGIQSGLVAAGSWSAFGKYLPWLNKTAPAVTDPGEPAEPAEPPVGG